MNAAHWLWAGTGFFAFHEAVASRRHAEFETSEQFATAVAEIVQEAEHRAEEMERRFSSFERIADFVIGRARSSPDRMQPSWWGYEAGIAAGLCGDLDNAGSFLNGITDERVTKHAAPLLPLISHPGKFVSRINELVAQQRDALGLISLGRPTF